jgi:hypothetical protein
LQQQSAEWLATAVRVLQCTGSNSDLERSLAAVDTLATHHLAGSSDSDSGLQPIVTTTADAAAVLNQTVHALEGQLARDDDGDADYVAELLDLAQAVLQKLLH